MVARGGGDGMLHAAGIDFVVFAMIGEGKGKWMLVRPNCAACAPLVMIDRTSQTLTVDGA